LGFDLAPVSADLSSSSQRYGSEVSYQNTHQQLPFTGSGYVIFRFILPKVAIAEVTAIIKRISSLVNFRLLQK
jgi:hypothetical protein